MTLLKEQLGTPFGKVQFGVQRSCRYHVARQKHYEKFARRISFYIIVLTSCWAIVIIGLPERISEWYGLIAPASVIFLSALDIVKTPSAMATTHRLLANQFSRLDMMMIRCEQKDDEMAASFQAQRQEIETQEPPSLTVASHLSHNELCEAIGSTQAVYHVDWFRRMFAHWNVPPPKKWVLLKDHEPKKESSSENDLQLST